MKFRKASADDSDLLWQMLEPVFRAGDTYAIDPDISREDALSYWLGATNGAWLVEEDTPLGTYYLKRNQPGGGAHVCNCGFVTAQDAGGKGVAREMLAHALEQAKIAGYRAMQFNFVISRNERAVRLWTRAGFNTVGRLPNAFEHPAQGYVDALVMYRDLTAEAYE
ncbi:GNAT family N-acetyltransferase [Qingshengfaniella alkalisoli]|uniref:GNAT family N-acetyltransferase n=1 Tax=Qingshengfaniella alkalisoli TaxID=2599296 RepID=A0A5B8J5L2_9RHOB|nr:GNAT family N-acetyltransferase [Qingshengfaniella alkalisoli]QDY69777.1 GNAT family N-acetyltransferase [Qingshengfaniella alkalisoli]